MLHLSTYIKERNMELVYPITDRDKLNTMAKYLKEHNYRDYVMFEVGINLGIRVSDFSQQKVGFYREAVNKGYVYMIAQKQKKKVMVAMSKELQLLILDYIKDKSDEQWMFESRKAGAPLTRVQIYRILNDAADYAGIEDNIGCHSMRKTFGYWHYYYNKDIRLLMEIFNHSREEVTLRYIGVTADQIKKSAEVMNLGL